MINSNSSYDTGILTESYVKSYLIKHNYKILFSRWKNNNKKGTGLGEIDIIAKQSGTIVFIEVKARNNINNIFYSISNRQQQRIMNSAIIFMSKHPEYKEYDLRFDAIFVLIKNNKQDITHIENAFDASNVSGLIGL